MQKMWCMHIQRVYIYTRPSFPLPLGRLGDEAILGMSLCYILGAILYSTMPAKPLSEEVGMAHYDFIYI